MPCSRTASPSLSRATCLQSPLPRRTSYLLSKSHHSVFFVHLLILMVRLSPLLLALLLAGPVWAAEPEVLHIKTLPAQMRYDVTELIVQPGLEMKLVFENPDDMPHNIIFFQPGTDVIAVCN